MVSLKVGSCNWGPTYCTNYCCYFLLVKGVLSCHSPQIPGLAENRPSVLRGDQLFVRKYLGPDKYGPKEYQGYVHEVQQTRVFLGFSQQ